MTERILLRTPTSDVRKAELYEKEGGAPEIFVDGAWGSIISSSGTVKIQFYTTAMPSEGDSERRELAVRLTMNCRTVKELRDYLSRQVETLVERGVLPLEEVPAAAPKPETKPRKKSRRKKSK